MLRNYERNKWKTKERMKKKIIQVDPFIEITFYQLPNGFRHGEYICKMNESTQLLLHYSFVMDKYDGEYREWFPNGILKLNCFYKNGNREGEYRRWYDNGQLEVHCFLVNDKRNGEFKSYYEDGGLKKHLKYENGVKVGQFQDGILMW